MGLVARFIEENDISTILLTMTPEFNREIGIPRIAAIEYPYGRVIGEVNDTDGQRQVLRDTLSVLAAAKNPGEVVPLPYTWPEDPKSTKWHPPEASPIIKMHLEAIKKAGNEARK